jgi:hypothetical protein
MAWIKIENNTIIQKQPYHEEGFVKAPDDVICGMIKEGDSFVNPPETLDNALGNLRFKRNSLLAETDWWGASDNTMTADQTKYRKDLRDLPSGLDTVEKTRTKLEKDTDGSYKNFPSKP